ncbi:hypothetical protein ACP275_04G032300 [Erythranthe tilingii]
MENFPKLVFVLVALFSVGGCSSMFVDADCVEYHPDVRCEVDKPEYLLKCQSLCKKSHGDKTIADCVKIHQDDTPFCVCNFCQNNQY